MQYKYRSIKSVIKLTIRLIVTTKYQNNKSTFKNTHPLFLNITITTITMAIIKIPITTDTAIAIVSEKKVEDYI